MKKTFFAIAVVLALSSMTAFAAPVTGGFTLAPNAGSVAFAPAGNLGSATSVTLTGTEQTNSAPTGYFVSDDPTPIDTPVAFDPSTFTFVTGPGVYLVGYTNLMTWNGGNSKFAATTMRVTSSDPDNLNIRFIGTYTNLSAPFSSSAELNFAFGQVGGAISTSAAFGIPARTPEPATILLLGSALVAVGLVRRYAR